MKLLTKYNRANITATITVLILSSICYYFILHFVLLQQVDDALRVEEQEILDHVKRINALPIASSYADQQITFEPVPAAVGRQFSSGQLFNKVEKRNEYTRRLRFSLKVNNQYYLANIDKSQEETEDLAKIILLITSGMVLILLFVLLLLNRLLFNRLWQPFHSTLSQLSKFEVTNVSEIQFQPTEITEFKELNDTVGKMTHSVKRDYHALKSFTENASHEIQTPLAIIQSKLELLTQGENLKEEQLISIQTIQQASNRLSKLNQSLLLLTKIENQQFQLQHEVNFEDLFNRMFSEYEELLQAKNIRVEKKVEAPCFASMNDALSEILVSNLLVNAIKHNIEGGKITVELHRTGFSICNSGPQIESDPMELFGRFIKQQPGSDSLGLGLAIVKTICQRYNFNVVYSVDNGIHCLKILFAPAQIKPTTS